jgi:hypothetical protein
MKGGEMTVSTKQDQVKDIARKIISGDMSIIRGCRQLVKLIDWDMDLNKEDLYVILVVDSETEGYPLEEHESLWLPEALRAKKVQMNEYVARVREDVTDACELLVLR